MSNRLPLILFQHVNITGHKQVEEALRAAKTKRLTLLADGWVLITGDCSADFHAAKASL